MPLPTAVGPARTVSRAGVVFLWAVSDDSARLTLCLRSETLRAPGAGGCPRPRTRRDAAMPSSSMIAAARTLPIAGQRLEQRRDLELADGLVGCRRPGSTSVRCPGVLEPLLDRGPGARAAAAFSVRRHVAAVIRGGNATGHLRSGSSQRIRGRRRSGAATDLSGTLLPAGRRNRHALFGAVRGGRRGHARSRQRRVRLGCPRARAGPAARMPGGAMTPGPGAASGTEGLPQVSRVAPCAPRPGARIGPRTAARSSRRSAGRADGGAHDEPDRAERRPDCRPFSRRGGLARSRRATDSPSAPTACWTAAPSGLEVSARTNTPRPVLGSESSGRPSDSKPRYGRQVTASAASGEPSRSQASA